jgi:hypothetical protein
MRGVLVYVRASPMRRGVSPRSRPGLHHLVVRIGCEVGIPLGCSVAFMPEERLDVILGGI